jgi:hypothetical protein
VANQVTTGMPGTTGLLTTGHPVQFLNTYHYYPSRQGNNTGLARPR